MQSAILTWGAEVLPVVENKVGMLFACWAIVMVLLAVEFVFLRSGKKNYVIAILPLLVTPFVHIISGLIARIIMHTVPLTFANLRTIIDVTAGLISCLLLGLTSRSIEERRSRLAFFWCCAGFVIILTWVLVINTLTMPA